MLEFGWAGRVLASHVNEKGERVIERCELDHVAVAAERTSVLFRIAEARREYLGRTGRAPTAVVMGDLERRLLIGELRALMDVVEERLDEKVSVERIMGMVLTTSPMMVGLSVGEPERGTRDGLHEAL